MSYLANLTKEQRTAVETSLDTNTLILAGPGTGKTRVLTSRYLYLRNKGFRPEDIVLLTFTNKAAREMMVRISNKMDYCKDFTGTFHHFSYALLKETGYSFTILDQDHQIKCLDLYCRQKNIRSSVEKFLRLFSYFRNAMRQPSFGNPELTALANYYVRYKEEHDYFDFDDLLYHLLEVLQKGLSLPVSHILVDEYQDTNRLQFEILNLLRNGNSRLFAVSDWNQAIYSFRAADLNSLTSYETDFAPVSVFHLSFNFRSTRPITLLCSDFIRRNQSCYSLNLRAERTGPVPAYLFFPDPVSEAEKISELVKEYYLKGSTAILCRVKRWFPLLEWKLSEKEIPFTVKGKTKYFKPPRDAVTISTIHSAKGLEWDNVFVVGLCEGFFPHRKSIEEGKLEEERRLLYVALSRARERLWLSFVGEGRFLRELNIVGLR